MTSSLTRSAQFLPPQRPPAAWVAEKLAVLPVSSALCLFTGWGAEARALRQLGWSIATADLLPSSVWWNEAFIGEETLPLSDRQVNEWLKLCKEPEIVKRFMSWANRYVTAEEAIWLGIWHHHLVEGDWTRPARALGIVTVYWVLRYWLQLNRQDLGFKPMPPSMAFRHYVAQANQLLNMRLGASHGVGRLAPDLALSKYPADLLYCYVPALEGIETPGSVEQLLEQWTQGSTIATPSPFPVGTLGGVFAHPDDHLNAVARLLAAADALPYVALTYHGSIGPALEALLEQRRPLIAHEEWRAPYPSTEGSSIIVQGILIAGSFERGATDEGISE